MLSRPGSPSRKIWDEYTTLIAHGIHIDVPDGWPFPAELNNHIEQVLLAKRANDTPRSPNASKIVGLRRMAALENEDTGIRMIVPLLLFSGERPPETQGIPKITSQLKINLSRDYLPLELGNIASRLTRPQPDTAIGYLSRLVAMQSLPALESAFSILDETFLKE